MRRVLTAIGYGAAGLLVAVALTLGAYALAGKDLGEPAQAHPGIHSGRLVAPGQSRSPQATHTDRAQRSGSDDHDQGGSVGGSSQPQASPTEDRGGGTGSSGPDGTSGGHDDGSGSGGTSGGDDHSDD